MKRIVKTLPFLALIAAVLTLPACPLYEGCSPSGPPPPSLREIDADSPVIAIGGKSWGSNQDVLVAAWVQSDNISTDKRAYTGHYHFGWGWYFPKDVDDYGKGQATLLRVAAGTGGSEFVVWCKITPLGSRIYANRLPSHELYTEWETAQALTDDVTVLDIAVAADAQGNAIVIWVQPDFPYTRLYARRYTPDDGWGAAEMIDDNSGHCTLPRIAVDASGKAIALWQLGGGALTHIYANEFSPTTGWGTSELISNGSTNAFDPDVAMNSSGSGMAVWQEDEGGTYNAYSRHFDPVIGWETGEVMETGSSDAYAIQVDMDETGVAVAAWRQPDIYFNRYTPGSGWGEEQLMTEGFVDNPAIAANTEGKTVITWNQWDPSGPYPGDALIYARKFDPVTGWEEAIELSSEPGSADAPDAEIDSEGEATVIWSQSVASGESGSTSAVFTYSY